MNSSQLLKLRTSPRNCGPCIPTNITMGYCPCPNSDSYSKCGIGIISYTPGQPCQPCKTNPPSLLPNIK